jgi:hypothetical protein
VERQYICFAPLDRSDTTGFWHSQFHYNHVDCLFLKNIRFLIHTNFTQAMIAGVHKEDMPVAIGSTSFL